MSPLNSLLTIDVVNDNAAGRGPPVQSVVCRFTAIATAEPPIGKLMIFDWTSVVPFGYGPGAGRNGESDAKVQPPVAPGAPSSWPSVASSYGMSEPPYASCRQL